MPLATSIYQEGIRIPPVHLVRRGELVRDVMSLILTNVRTPREREGDLTAQIASNRTGLSPTAFDRGKVRPRRGAGLHGSPDDLCRAHDARSDPSDTRRDLSVRGLHG